jgi:sulfatase modifying factor 1
MILPYNISAILFQRIRYICYKTIKTMAKKNTCLYILLLIIVLTSCKHKENKEATKVHAKNKLVTDTLKDTKVHINKKSARLNPEQQKEMVFFEGGKIIIGAKNDYPDQAPPHECEIKPFYIDKHLVTVSEFRKFVESTGFETDAEKFGNAGVYHLRKKRWFLINGATWEYPQGPDKPKAKDNHPVTQVSWRDAMAYCQWAKKRLPTEYEWEYAAKCGKNTNKKYAWGDKIYKNGEFHANIWQGDLQTKQGGDGYIFTSPVGAFGPNDCGLTDMGGNVWEWCQNTYKAYPGNNMNRMPNPQIKAIRGGSFFYDEAGKESFTTTFRGKNTTETSLFNMGFRCAKDAN